jgi:hypothetical protein
MKSSSRSLSVVCAIIGVLVLLQIFRAIFLPTRSTNEFSRSSSESSSESSTSQPSVPPAGLPTNWRHTVLTPNATSFDWSTWKIAIRNLTFTDEVPEMFGSQKTAGSDSIFVYFSFTVTNESHEGDDFIPQNNLKLMTGGNKYDAADIERSGESYLSNIEPTLTRSRECYFELPRSQVGDYFTIRFKRMFGESRDLLVSLSTPGPTPSPTPLAQSTPTPSPTPGPSETPTPGTAATPTAMPTPTLSLNAGSWPDGRILKHPEHSTQTYVVNVARNDTLKLRSGPGTKFPAIAEIPGDATGVSVFDQDQIWDGDTWWCPVEWKGLRGYVSRSYLPK